MSGPAVQLDTKSNVFNKAQDIDWKATLTLRPFRFTEAMLSATNLNDVTLWKNYNRDTVMKQPNGNTIEKAYFSMTGIETDRAKESKRVNALQYKISIWYLAVESQII